MGGRGKKHGPTVAAAASRSYMPYSRASCLRLGGGGSELLPSNGAPLFFSFVARAAGPWKQSYVAPHSALRYKPVLAP